MHPFTINVKGEPSKKDPRFVKLSLIFYVPGYNRVPKILKEISGLYAEWDNQKQCFINNKKENIDKNLKILKLKSDYQHVAEKWISDHRAFSPIELAHYFEKQQEELGKGQAKTVKVLKVTEVLHEKIKFHQEKERIKNGKLLKGAGGSAEHYFKLERVISVFTKEKYNRSFNSYFFPELTSQFIYDFIFYLEKKGIGNKNKGNLKDSLKTLRALVYHARKTGIPDTNHQIFYKDDTVKQKMKDGKFKPKSQPAEFYERIENMDKSEFTKKELFHIDMLLFSFYAGGIGNTDVCNLTYSSINDGILQYERMKFVKDAKVPLISKAVKIINKYKGQGYDDYVFPIFTRKQVTEVQKYRKVAGFGNQVNTTLRKITRLLKYKEKVTWYSSRGSYITKMVKSGFNVIDVASHAGNSVKTILKHYYKPNEAEIREKMEQLF